MIRYYTKSVPLTVAKALRDAGYNELCFYFYHEDLNAKSSKIGTFTNWNEEPGFISMPTYAEVLDWLLNKEVLIEEETTPRTNGATNFIVRNTMSEPLFAICTDDWYKDFDTCIIKALEILKNYEHF